MKQCSLTTGLAQAEFNYSARKRWEMEQAEGRALELHHEQIERGVNRFAQALALAQIMEDIEQTDNLAGLQSTATPSWIRAHFRSKFGTLLHSEHQYNPNPQVHHQLDACPPFCPRLTCGFVLMDDKYESIHSLAAHAHCV